MAVPYIFGTATASIPLSNLDSNFATTITLGNTAIQLGNTVTTLNNMTLANVTVNTITSAAGTALTLQSNNGNTAVTIDTSQNVGIGTTSPSVKLHVVGDNASNRGQLSLQTSSASNFSQITFYNQSTFSAQIYQSYSDNTFNINNVQNAAITFLTNSAERMRIDSSGNLLVGQTARTTTEKFGVTQSDVGSSVARFYASSASYTNDIVQISCARSGATTEYNAFTVSDNNTTLKMLIRPNGNLLNANNSYGSLSDISLKENIVDATPKLDGLMQVKVRNYNLKDDVNKTKQIGVVAQELETVFPGMIETDGDGIKAVKYSVFVPMLLKAIQEQQALITSLTARIAALEAK